MNVIHQPTSAAYNNNIIQEIIDYTPHSGTGWAEDNAAMFQVVSDIVNDIRHVSSIKAFVCTRNSKEAIQAL